MQNRGHRKPDIFCSLVAAFSVGETQTFSNSFHGSAYMTPNLLLSGVHLANTSLVESDLGSD